MPQHRKQPEDQADAIRSSGASRFKLDRSSDTGDSATAAQRRASRFGGAAGREGSDQPDLRPSALKALDLIVGLPGQFRIAIFIEYDAIVAPGAEPAAPTESMLEAIRRVASRHPVAIVSERGLRELSRLVPIEGLHHISGDEVGAGESAQSAARDPEEARRARAILWMSRRLQSEGPLVRPLYIGNALGRADAARALRRDGLQIAVGDLQRDDPADLRLADAAELIVLLHGLADAIP
ncbi:MAG: hypothetical protein VYC34_12070 [Planctomycetota bacterium]|nr:hypothetical protein [Planctomycetota bacterium]